MSADGHGVVSHAGSRLLADLSDATGLPSAFSDALRQLRPRGTGHGPDRIAVMLADGSEATADLALLRDQPQAFGPVASTPTRGRGPNACSGPLLGDVYDRGSTGNAATASDARAKYVLGAPRRKPQPGSRR